MGVPEPLSVALPDGMEDGGSARQPALAGQFNYVPPQTRPYPPAIAYIRKHIFNLFMMTAFFGTAIWLLIAYWQMTDRSDELFGFRCSKEWKDLFKFLSIPLVSIIFTWWHVWLGIKMCFYPVEFVGCCPPVLGWQGIVPRRAKTMATRCCDIMIGTLITIEEIIDRIEPGDFFTSLEQVLAHTSEMVLARVAQKHCPSIWGQLPDKVKAELQKKVLEECRKMFHPVVADLKHNIGNIIDIKQMAIDVLVSNKPLLVDMFQRIGSREFLFVQHVAAVMGFILGVIQMFLWIFINRGGEGNDWAGYVILPVSGLLIGTFTNWLGITMIFRPVEPHIICGGYVNIQGVFLKRQVQVSEQLAFIVCKELVNARTMLGYAIKADGVIDRILEIYQHHIDEAIHNVMGRAKVAMPLFVGKGAMVGIKDEVIQTTLEELPKHSQQIEEYMDRAFGLPETLRVRLAGLHPKIFEGMLHPVFQEDEWMVLLLGGVLGVTVGTLQAFALGS